MLDEIEVPTEKQTFYICPCCKFTFTTIAEFTSHCDAMIVTINKAVEQARKRR